MLSNMIYRLAKKSAPKLSDTEKDALNIGEAFWEGELFKGTVDWKKLEKCDLVTLTEAEQSFLDHETNILLSLLDDWEIVHEAKDLPPRAWQYIKEAGFWGLIIPKAYGGKEFSPALHSRVVMKLATRSLTTAVTVMVPNSLGPGELLLRYGTKEQKQYYLPRLAKGQEIPCFALTGPEAGSDAANMPDYGVVCAQMVGGKRTLGIKLSFSKRYITLAPVATLIGLAFKLYDPDHLLSDVEDRGITVVLMPRDTTGLHIGERHLPLDQAFMNGTIQGENVFVPLDAIIGGREQIGQGWHMLVECLAVGRAISLPAISTAYGSLCYVATGAYSSVRRQFNVSLSEFEGIEEAMAKIGGFAYILDACRLLTLTGTNHDSKPAVASAIAKFHMTEHARAVLNHTMDIHGGKGVMMGPRNYLARAYEGIPICITVEGANILTRNLIIYGQGSMLCHPHLRYMTESLNDNNKAAFKKALKGFQRHFFKNVWLSIWYSLTRAAFVYTPSSRLGKYYRKISFLSNRFAILSDLALMILGGQLKRKERLSARLGDALSFLYLASSILKYYQSLYEPEDEESIAQWGLQYCLYQARAALADFITNFKSFIPRALLRWWLLPGMRGYRLPNDDHDRKVAQSMTQNTSVRDRFKSYCYVDPDEQDGFSHLEQAYQQLQKVKPLLTKLKQWQKEKKVSTQATTLASMQEAHRVGLLSEEEWQQFVVFEGKRVEAISVDVFNQELHLIRRKKMTHANASPLSLEAQFEEMVERVKTGKVDLQPTPAQKLELYALYKQATEGDVSGDAPGITDFVARAKYSAWEKVKGMSKEEAMRRYIQLLG